MTTPSGMFYTASGDITSHVEDTEVESAITFSTDIGPFSNYILALNLDLVLTDSFNYRLAFAIKVEF